MIRSICVLAAMLIGVGAAVVQGQAFVPPASPRVTFSFNSDWKFIREDAAGADAVQFDDSKWETVSTPHSFNDVDSFRTIISHGGGDRGTFKGIAWYRKHFKIPSEYAGRKVFLEFEGMRQAGDISLNGKAIGLYENGVTAYGIDISSAVHTGDEENVLSVKVDNRTTYQERATKTGFEWNANDFNPDHGGINRRVWLHITGDIYSTFPLYYGLETSGTYIYPSNISIANKTTDVTVESQVQNGSKDRATVGLSVMVVDKDGQVRAKFDGDPVDMVAGEKSDLTATGSLKDAHFWSPDDPYLYDVYTVLTVDGKVVDVNKNVTGFRKAEFKGGAGTGGVYINDQFVYLKGFAQRSSDEWAGIGAGYPEWMHDWTAKLIRECNGNYMRWMHVSPTRVDVDAFDRAGIIQVCPAGDKERDVTGRQWDQRLEVMRDSIIYFRNSPSILFWEAGNTVVTPEHITQMVDIRKQWDPHGGRVMGARGNDDGKTNTATTPIAEFYGVMIGQDQKTDQLNGPTDMFRAYSAERRNRAPLIETEDFRDEGARRFWDNFSPPYFGFKKGANDTYGYTSESFALAGARRYSDYWMNRISNADPVHGKWSGYASIYFSDSNADGRQDTSEVCRVSGKVDAVRLPKELYYVHRVMQNEQPDLHIIGHWNYPADTKKPVYVAANNVDAVELFLNDKSLGKVAAPVNLNVSSTTGQVMGQTPGGYIYPFPDVAFAPGTLRAVAYKGGKPIKQEELKTAGEPKALKLTVHTAPGGMKADGEDACFIDVEVVDANGLRCPTDDARVDFTCEGAGIWRGGYNSGKINSTNNLYLNTECGINRVAVRSTRQAGKITVTAKRDGLTPATVSVDVGGYEVKDGLSRELALVGR